MTAYYQEEPVARPAVSIFDTASDAGTAYRHAISAGAQFVIGPLGKEDVRSVSKLAEGNVPVLALNSLPELQTLPQRFFQFALSPEDEARQVAARLISEGRRIGIMLVAAGDWGDRVASAFAAALTGAGGAIAGTRTIARDDTGLPQDLGPLLGFEDSRKRYQAVTAAVGPLVFTPRHRDDLSFVMVLTPAAQGRLVRPQLKFQYAGDLPVYSISDIHEPNPIANQDLEGVVFTDTPWLIGSDPELIALRQTVQQLWPTRSLQTNRLFAMGFDSYRLMVSLGTRPDTLNHTVSGLTGRLTIDPSGRIRRELDWAVFGSDGQAHPVPEPST